MAVALIPVIPSPEQRARVRGTMAGQRTFLGRIFIHRVCELDSLVKTQFGGDRFSGHSWNKGCQFGQPHARIAAGCA
jgi:hypothetical protein